jgi:hypothetical protein
MLGSATPVGRVRPQRNYYMKRRDFLKTSLTVSTLAGLSTASLSASAAEPAAARQEYYEWRVYRLKSTAARGLLDEYLEKAAIPAWDRLGLKPVGVFVQQERTGNPANTEVRDPLLVYVLIPYPSLAALAATTARLNEDAEYQKAGAKYLQVKTAEAAFDRIDSWLMLAFAGMPKLELAAYSRDKKPRMFEVRTYESYSEVKALKKVEMFNSGEIQAMREVGLAPVFYGQALIGRDLPHLTYMTSAEDSAAHVQHWAAFNKHPVWMQLNKDPQYAGAVSKNTNRFLVPTPYSGI